MGATKDGKGTSRVPRPLAEAVARAVEAAIATRWRGKSERVIAKEMGITQPALNKIRHADGALGVNALLALREALRMSLDDLLGLPPIAAMLSSDELERVRAILRAELDAPRETIRPPKGRPVR